MTIEKFKHILKLNGYPTMTAFCRATGENRYDLQKLLSMARYEMTPERKKELTRLSRLAKSAGQDESYYITDKLRDRLKDSIEERGGVISFSKENGLSKDSIFQILSGKRRRRTTKVNQLIKLLNIQIS